MDVVLTILENKSIPERFAVEKFDLFKVSVEGPVFTLIGRLWLPVGFVFPFGESRQEFLQACYGQAPVMFRRRNVFDRRLGSWALRNRLDR